MGWQAGDVLTVQQDGAAARAHRPRQAGQRGGLAGTVAAQQGDQLALAGVHGDAVQDVAGPVVAVQSFDGEQHSSSSPR